MSGKLLRIFCFGDKQSFFLESVLDNKILKMKLYLYLIINILI